MNKVIIAFKSNEKASIIFESNYEIYWRVGKNFVDVFKKPIKNDLDSELIGVFSTSDVLYVICNECKCSAFTEK